jgi:hypothetical protein
MIMERLTLEDAISHAKEVAEKNYRGADFESIDYIDDDIKTNCIKCAEEHMQLAEWLEELKSYKEAEEQGLLVRLPCPVGTTVWDICGMDIRENVVCGIECGKNGKQFLWANHDEWLGELNDLVFLTREAAEKKLEEF